MMISVRKMKHCCLCFLSIASLSITSHIAVLANEPTNAQEAAEKKARENAEVAEKFAVWKETLSPTQQKWETVLEQNLGSFYLPLYQRDKIAGRVTAWDYVEETPGLPRVLLIGDSVSRGYTLSARKSLSGVANVLRAPENCGPTAMGLKKLDIWLGDGKWDVIHFNFGIHDRRTPIADYEARLEELIARMKGTGATLVWATTTPIPSDWKEGPEVSQMMLERDAVAVKVMVKHGIKVNDLYSLILPQLKETQNPQDVHFNGQGYELLGQQVAETIRNVLTKE
ncbi:MAG TPA: SGNH/GDSL hydrolase family protein [Planctomicrobium sp.]|nr:SGNH/GDSL hydrolase family protein [Planctomicrobium sp.]